MYIVKRFALIFIILSVITFIVGCDSKIKDIENSEKPNSNLSTTLDKKEDPGTKLKEKWKIEKKTDLPFDFIKCAFLNDYYGIATGFSGENRITSDGGQNWNLSMNKSNNSNAYDMVGENVIWYGDDFGDIGVSSDKGVTWQLSKGTFASRVSYISAINSEIALIANRDTVVFTEDGGKSIDNIRYKEDNQSIAALNLLSNNQVYILDYDGKLYYSMDKFKTWKNCVVGDLDGIIKIRSDLGTPSSTACIRNFNDGKIIIAFCDDNPGIYIMTSKDEGLSWKKEKVSDDIALNIYLAPDGKSITYNTGVNTVKRIVCD